MNLYRKPRRGVPGALECVCCFADCCFGCETARQFYDNRPRSLDGLCTNESKEEEASEDDA